MKTIRQIADELGVSKQTVYKRFKGKLHMACAPYAHTEHGILYIDEQGEALIKQDFLQDDHPIRAVEHGQQADLMAILKATIDTLQEQLEMKDQQIEQQAQTITRLTDALVAAHQTAEAVQALHAETMHQQLLSGEAGQHGQEQKSGQKWGWISRFFGG